ncbi:hypothetical protein LEP3755_29020 [Leptolyngbya sp. NIES-3755]|nr:hypothetical protein LEP3755_29020 [Leptolyngbya sp. NIES-3755]
MSDETPIEGAIELSDEDLDEVSGGFNLRITAARFHQSNISISRSSNAGARCGGSQSTFEAQEIESAALQITITDATTDDLEILSGLFGNASAIEGSD